MKTTAEYKAIQIFYGDRCAERSGVRLMQHIDDGLVVLDAIVASEHTKRAYCLHPLFQGDLELVTQGLAFARSTEANAYVVMLAMEYRACANAWLSDKVCIYTAGDVVDVKGSPDRGCLLEVKHMLIADKVQNCKDFVTYHGSTHSRSAELVMYFDAWLDALGVSHNQYLELCSLIDSAKAQR